jgi:hypothetical protein
MGKHSMENAETSLRAAVHSMENAETSLRAAVTTDGVVDAQKLLGAYAGWTSGISNDLERVKRYLEANDAFTPFTAASYAWSNLDDIVCYLRELYGLFQEYVQGPQ